MAKARLRQPIPVPDTAVLPKSNLAQQSLPDTSPDVSRGRETYQNELGEQFGRTPWPMDQGTAWKPITEDDRSRMQLDESDSNARAESRKPQSNSFPPSAAVDGVSSDDVAIDVGATQPITDVSGSTESEPDSATMGASGDLAPEATPVQEPTMLDRFRGLYTPRLEDNTDKLRKQIRRWPDPFRLLKDRDETAESGPVTSPFPSAEQDAASVEPLTSTDASPSVPVSAASPLDTVIADLEKELSKWPATPTGKPQRPDEWRQRQTDLRLLYMVAGRAAESMRVIESLPEEEQEFWQSMMLSMNRYRATGSDSDRAEQLSETLNHLRTASRKLQPLSKLQIHRMMFCDRIDGFGQASAFPTADFNPGQRVLIYTDVRNFRSELTPEGNYRSEFAAVIEFMRQGDDEVVETIRIPQILDDCSTERTDYFQSFEITLPALAGQYQVKIRLRDQLSLQTAESQLGFNIRSQSSGL